MIIPLTDTRGRVLPESDPEPRPGSVVLTNGEHGTAWQRYFTDGLWHRVGGGRGKTWVQMLAHRNLVLIYEARHRPDQSDQPARPMSARSLGLAPITEENR